MLFSHAPRMSRSLGVSAALLALHCSSDHSDPAGNGSGGIRTTSGGSLGNGGTITNGGATSGGALTGGGPATQSGGTSSTGGALSGGAPSMSGGRNGEAARGGAAGRAGGNANAGGFVNGGRGGANAAGAAGEAGPAGDGGDAGAGGMMASGGATSTDDATFLIAADISWVQEDEAGGAKFVDTDGSEKDILALLKNHGFNTIRLRTFVDPKASDGYSADGYCDLAHTITMAQRIKQAGMKFLLDFHYSDNWADPGKQCVPVAWQSDDLDGLVQHVYDYTKDALTQLKAASASPDMVQIGNEITPGMLIHRCNSSGSPTSTNPVNGSTSNWDNLAALLKSGIEATRDVDPQIRIMLHIDRGGDASASEDWIQKATSRGVEFDVFGESCYVAYQGQPSGWKSTFDTLSSAFPDLSFAIAEYNNESVTSPANTTSMRAANDVMFNLADHRGLGTFIWEPTHSGAWGKGLFKVSGHTYTADATAFAAYDDMETAYASRL